MTIEHELKLDRPRKKVWGFLNNPDSLKLWQPDLESIDLIEGKAGKPDAVSLLTYKKGRHRFQITETIIGQKKLTYFAAIYWDQNQLINNTVENFFTAKGSKATYWRLVSHFDFNTAGSWLKVSMLKVLITRRVKNDMQRFKKALENS